MFPTMSYMNMLISLLYESELFTNILELCCKIFDNVVMYQSVNSNVATML